MSLRWQFERDTRFLVPVKVEITDSEYSGSVITLPFVGDSPVVEQLGEVGSDPLSSIKASFVEIRMRGVAGDFDDLFSRNNERFRVKVFVDGDLWSEFIPVPDTFSEPVTGGNYEITIRAGNLSLLKQVDIFDILTKGERISKLDAIYQIISHFFTFPVVDGTITYPSGANQSTSALSQIFFNTDRFDESQSSYSALEWLIGQENQIRVTRGRAFVIPVLEASFTGYEYNGSTIGSGVLYNQNFSSEKIGGRLSVERKGLISYSGVERIYKQGDLENLVPSGDLGRDDFELVLGLQGEPGNPARIPIGWSYESPPRPQPPVSVRTERDEWKIGILAGIPLTEYSFDADSGISIQENQRLLFKFRGSYDNVNDKDTVFVVRIQVKAGSLYLSDLTGSGGVLNWVSDSNATIRIPLSESGQSDYEIFTTPIPDGGELEYRVIINRDNVSAGGNFIFVNEIKALIADENGDVIIESDTLAGSRGSVYEYTEQFGDGFTSASPGALFFDGEPTERWNIVGIPDGAVANLPLSDIQTKYLASELTRDRERITGTVDTFDTIALIDSKRVNYIQTDFRYGRSNIELVEIKEHNLTETVEDRKIKAPETQTGISIDRIFEFPDGLMPFLATQAVGVTTADYENDARESIEVELTTPMRSGFEYWIINESQLDRTDRQAGVYAVNPLSGAEGAVIEYQTGTVDIEEQTINAPEGSLIFLAPGQVAVNENRVDERVKDGEENIENLQDDLGDLEVELNTLNTVTLPALQDELDDLEADLDTLNTVTLPNLQNELDENADAINELETVTIPNLQNELDDILPITETKISNDAISTPKIQTNAIIAGKIASGAVTTVKLDALAVTAAKIAAGAIVTEKLAANAVTANEIAADAVIANKIQAGAVIAGKIGADAVVANNIAANAVTTNKIQAGAITTEKIGANQVTANKIDVSDLYATDATIGATLTLGSGGKFTNAGGDFEMDASGLEANYTAGSSGLKLDFTTGEADFFNIKILGEELTSTDQFINPPILTFAFGSVDMSGSGQTFIVSWGVNATVVGTDTVEIKHFRNGTELGKSTANATTGSPNSKNYSGGSSSDTLYAVVSLLRGGNAVNSITTRDMPVLL